MTTPKAAARAAQDSTAFRIVARIGYVVLGILHIVIGVIAISIATGGGGEADQGGAMEQIRNAPMGVLLLWVIVLGLFALAIWQIAEAFLERNPDTKKKWGYRVKYIGTAVAYIAIAITAVVYALGGQSDSSQSSQSLQRAAAGDPGRRVPAGPGRPDRRRRSASRSSCAASRGPSRSTSTFRRTPAARASSTFGVVGYIAKGIAVGVAGVLFVVAAVTARPRDRRAGWMPRCTRWPGCRSGRSSSGSSAPAS